jgi:GT2 family glycosyltransferase
MEKQLSSLLISDGCLHGWAFDALRETLTLELLVDGRESARATTGFKVAAEFFASAVPPSLFCGYRIPLPINLLDGRTHAIVVRVRDWAPMHNAPTAGMHWRHGDCAGDWVLRPDGSIEGCVAFVNALEPGQLPQVHLYAGYVSLASTDVHPEPVCYLPQFKLLTRFRFEPRRFEGLRKEDLRVLCRDNWLQSPTEQTDSLIRGVMEEVSVHGIRGWALDTANLRSPLNLVVCVDDVAIQTIRPQVMRHDVVSFLKLLPAEAGLAGFHADLPAILRDGRPHQVVVKARDSGKTLEGCPVTFRFRDQSFDLATAAGLLSKQVSAPLRLPPAPRRPRAKPLLTAIILNRNGASCLEGLFQSFEKHNTVPIHFIVIDHASSDDSLALLTRWQTRLSLEVVALQENHSFSASCNRGASLARTPYLLFLNNDIVWAQDALPAMITSLRERTVGLVGLRLHKTLDAVVPQQLPHPANTEVQHLGVQFVLSDGHYWPFELRSQQAPAHLVHRPSYVAAVTGAVLLCRRAEFLASGGFDEGYFYGYEDVELCLRFREQLGLQSVCRNDLIALHHHGYTRLTGREPAMVDHHLENQKKLARKIGVWIKRRYWQSLLVSDGLLTSETLKVGLVISSGKRAQLQQAFMLATELQQSFSGIEPLFVGTAEGLDRLGDCHVIIAIDPAFDLRLCATLRADVRLALCVLDAETSEDWEDNPALDRYDRCLFPDALANSPQIQNFLARLSPCTGSVSELLKGFVAAETLRVALHMEGTVYELGKHWKKALERGGVLAWIQEKNQQTRIADVDLYFFDKTTALLHSVEGAQDTPSGGIRIAIVSDVPSSKRLLASGWFTRIWLLNNNLSLRSAALPTGIEPFKATDQRLRGLARALQRYVDEQITRTFSAS